MADLEFEKLLAEQNQAYKDAEEYSDWMPEDGEYIVTVMKCQEGKTEKDGVKTGWWKLTARIEAPENEQLNGQEFTLGWYRTSAMGILKSQAKALNGGKVVETLPEANAVLENAIGKVLRVKVTTTTSKKNGQDYTNCYIQEVIPVTNAETTEVPPQG